MWCSDSDKSAKGRHKLVSDRGFAYRDPDPVWPEAGKGLAAAYSESVIPHREAEPARFPISAYTAGVNQYEGRLRAPCDAEAQTDQLLDEVGPPRRDFRGRRGSRVPGLGCQAGGHRRSASISLGSPIT